MRAVIECGLAHGWDRLARGGTFVLTESEHAAALDVPGFLLTDRLWTPDAPMRFPARMAQFFQEVADAGRGPAV